MNTKLYSTFKESKQQSFNKLPMGAAFSDKQFEEMCAKWGLNPKNEEDLKQIMSIGSGCFCLKKDWHLFEEWTIQNDKEQEEMFNNDEFLRQGFYYEFANHECQIGGDKEVAIFATGISTEMRKTERVEKLIQEAWEIFWKDCADNDWF